jgi:hypothetical protein
VRSVRSFVVASCLAAHRTASKVTPAALPWLVVKTSQARLPLYGECAWRGDLTD